MDNEVKIQFKNSITGEKKLEKYKETLTQINSVLNGLNKGAAKELEQSASNTKDIADNVKDMKNKSDVAFNYTTVRAFSRGIQRVAQAMGSYVNKSSTYYENLNLLTVAFRGNTLEADKFVNKLSEMYGLDENWGYRTVGIFKQLANAMGLADKIGTKLSTTMTQFAIDVSSLYNIETNDAVSILTSALAGQTKPARRLGADITQGTLQQTLNQAGIDKAISDLSYAEKRLVIIASLLTQVSEATNDWGKTIESPANQTRILSEQWERLTRTLGNIFLPVVYRLLPYLNGILMVLTEIAQIIANIVATFLGFSPEDLDFGAGTASDAVVDLSDNLNVATGNAKKLKNEMSGLRSFDKLINITTPKDTGSGGAGASGVSADILNLANKAMDDYNKKLQDVQMKATKIRDSIMEWLGFTKQVDEETGKVSWKFDHITSGTVLGGLAIGGIIYKGVHSIYKILKKFGLIKLPDFTKLVSPIKTILDATGKIGTKLFPSIAEGSIVIGGFLFSVATLKKTYEENEEFRKKIDNLKTAINNLKEAAIKLWDRVSPIIQNIYDALAPIITKIIKFLEKLGKIAKDVLESTVIRYFTQMIDKITAFANIFSHLVDGDIEGAFNDLGNLVSNLWDDWKDAFDKIVGKVGELLENVGKLPEELGRIMGEAVGKIINKIEETDWVEEGKKIFNGIKDGIGKIIDWCKDLPGKIWDKLNEEIKKKENGQDNWLDLGYDIVSSIIKGAINALNGGLIRKFVDSFVTGLNNELKKSDIGSKVSKGVDIWTWLAPGVQSFKAANTAKNKLFSLLGLSTGGVYSNGKWNSIQRYDAGGTPNTGQLFWARENGLPELVGTMGGHTAVMNNDQIVGSVSNGVYRAVMAANSQTQRQSNGIQHIDIYLDKNHKLASYTLDELQSMARSNGKIIEIS